MELGQHVDENDGRGQDTSSAPCGSGVKRHGTGKRYLAVDGKCVWHGLFKLQHHGLLQKRLPLATLAFGGER